MRRRGWKEIAAAIAASTVTGALAFALAMGVFRDYSTALFSVTPFAMGFFAVLAANAVKRCDEFMRLTALATVMPYLMAFAVGIEGLACILVALPLALPSLAGGWLARRFGASRGVVAVMAITPFAAIVGEHLAAPPVPERAVRTTVIVNAPPPAVWRQAIASSELPPPRELLFRTGAGYPIRAEILGTGPGSIRRGIFSTGAFVERVTVWDEPRKLAFDITEQPPALRELSPWNVNSPHMSGYIESRRGQFELTELPGGRTKLEATTWYSNRISPEPYWRLFTDYIVHRIHERVLGSVAERAERAR